AASLKSSCRRCVRQAYPMPPDREVPMKSALRLALMLVASVVAITAQKPAPMMAPSFEVDPFWPKPLPNHWVTGSTIGVSVDAQDNVWTIHRPNTVDANFKAADIMTGDARGRDDEAQPSAAAVATSSADSRPIGRCCKVAPPVLVYDQAGTL